MELGFKELSGTIGIEGKWTGTDCQNTEVGEGSGLFAICKRPKLVEGTTQKPPETTIGVVVETFGKNETKKSTDKEEGFFVTDEVLISLALIQLPAVVLAVLGIAKAFHKHGCTCQGLHHVFKASLLVFIPFFLLELVGSVLELLGLCLGLIPCSRVIQKIHRVLLF